VIKLKDILLEGKPPTIFVPRRLEDRVERMIKNYIHNGNKGNLSLSGLNLTVLPEILKDIDVGGSFVCSNNKLTSLNNLPKYVGKSFYCDDNKLTSLTGIPAYVSGNFVCSNNLLTELPSMLKDIDIELFFSCANNKLTSLNNSPKSVGESFYCGYNQLISLKGAPTYVGGNFVCSNNLLTSLDGAPKTVGGAFTCGDNSVQFTEAQVRAVCDVKGRIFV
jgi:hypothetical protein